MDFDLEKKRVQLLFFIVGIIALGITAEKFRQIIGEEASSKSGQFTFLNCLDMGSGTLACSVKEGVKLYFYNIRSSHVERARNVAMERAKADAASQGLSTKEAENRAQIEGKKAAKLATRQAKRIIGPIISSGWDFFEALYFGGTMTEGFLRGTGTLFGAYGGGFLGEQRLGRFGYLVGSHLGSWVGGRIGLMVYDVLNGIHYLLYFVENAESVVGDAAAAISEPSEESYISEPKLYGHTESPESSDEEGPNPSEGSSIDDNREYVESESLEDSSVGESPTYESFRPDEL